MYRMQKGNGIPPAKKDIVKNIRDKEYTFGITVAVCAKCGENMSIPELIGRNVKEIDEQYRSAESLFSASEKLLRVIAYVFEKLEEVTPFSELITKDRIRKYYENISAKYGIETENGLMNYIHDMLKKVS